MYPHSYSYPHPCFIGDSDWVGDVDDCKSTTGFVFYLGDPAFIWSSKKQPIVTLSTCETEYVAIAAGACHAIWLRNLLKEVQEPQQEATKIYVDNKSAIQWCLMGLQRSNKLNKPARQIHQGKQRKLQQRKGITRPPLNFPAILKDANISIDMSSPDKLCEQLYTGKYFVDKKSNKNCFVLFARELDICWNENPQYWRWTTLKETSFNIYLVWHAVVKRLKWLSYCRGQLNGAIDLSPGIVYEIVFVVRMIKYEDFSLKLTIILPNSKKRTRNESLNEKPLGSWFDIQLGEFKMSPENVGTMEFSLEDHAELWKSGLIEKCAIIRPKKEPE
ncbi:hypothetical protein HYC85_006303 [Camellia sinensis]|uniref:Uncharacterized protein n=1 Tax=Camellia sinensis TaxID=4442 RepID=A0A7J7HLY8_CAMSI|nr:hypothetical protein HYC85_006303 [Camellia sinensis]